MKVHELIKLLNDMPQFAEVKTENGEYLNDPDDIELDERNYVIIRNK